MNMNDKVVKKSGGLSEPVLIKNTKCLCPQCLEIIDAQVIERDGKIWLKKYCKKDGAFESPHLITKPNIYHALAQMHRDRSAMPEGLILKLTTRCNQYCHYCFTNANEKNMCDFDSAGIFKSAGNFKGDVIYLSGGEPTLREDLFVIVRRIKKYGFKAILFTNGKKLSNIDYVAGLKKAGIDAVILQFDSLDDADYIKIRGEVLLENKIRAVNNLKLRAIYLMLYVNIVEGINAHKITELFDFALKNNNVRILFFNPLWNIGRRASCGKLDSAAMLDIVCEKLKISEEYFIDCTRFSTYVFEILRKLRLKKGIKEPPCSVSCYFIRRRGTYLPFDYFMDLKKAGIFLKRMDEKIDLKRNRLSNIMRLIFNRDLYLLLTGVFFRKKTLEICLDNFLYNLRSPKRFQGLYFMFFNVLSVMVGQFPDKYTLDLSLTKTCNMHTALNENASLPTCLYEIYRDAGKIEQHLTV
ncbi:MAG: radical SAM protein [Candidatus Omnitrophica bacterium]|nr:radical SAM protein [Candidatus Omnitrophota bacterium]